MKISVICPVLNEAPWIGYSIMAGMPYIHEFIYALDAKSDDGTRELLHHVKERYAHEKLLVLDTPTFHPHDMGAYNSSFNSCIARMTGDAAMFLHPDMIITDGPKDEIPNGPMALWTTVTSYAGDLQTIITKGRATKWKNIHAKRLGLHYFGGYGSQNEDFYHSDITGTSYKHYGLELWKYPYLVADSGIKINHYCEVKDYSRRLEKMKLCLKTQNPTASDEWVHENAVKHPRVSLESSSDRFGRFEFTKSKDAVPSVIETYQEEFSQFKKELIHG